MNGTDVPADAEPNKKLTFHEIYTSHLRYGLRCWKEAEHKGECVYEYLLSIYAPTGDKEACIKPTIYHCVCTSKVGDDCDQFCINNPLCACSCSEEYDCVIDNSWCNTHGTDCPKEIITNDRD